MDNKNSPLGDDASDARVAAHPLPALLRATTEAMANHCRAPQDLWNRHSNAALDAAKLIDDLLEALEGVIDAIADAHDTWPALSIKGFLVADFPTSTSPNTSVIFNKALAVLAKATAPAPARELKSPGL